LLVRQIDQEGHGFFGDAVLRIVEQDVPESERKTLEALRIALEQVAQMQAGDLPVMFLQSQPSWGGSQRVHRRSSFGAFCDVLFYAHKSAAVPYRAVPFSSP
jgi:hypothetical protein